MVVVMVVVVVAVVVAVEAVAVVEPTVVVMVVVDWWCAQRPIARARILGVAAPLPNIGMFVERRRRRSTGTHEKMRVGKVMVVTLR